MGNAASQYSAEQYASCPSAAMGLNYNWSAMNTLVNNMVAAGNTNQAIGLQVGWLSIAGGGPFTVPAYDPNFTYQKVIILLTDGLNTQDRWYTDETSIDNRQKLTCDNVKAAGITLYTIQVNTGGDPTSTLLKNCASDPSKFFLLTVGEPDCHDLRPDRHQAVATSSRQITVWFALHLAGGTPPALFLPEKRQITSVCLT